MPLADKGKPFEEYRLNNINKIDSTILSKSESVVTRILLDGDESFKNEVNFLILNATIDFVFSSNRFDEIFSEFPFIHDYQGRFIRRTDFS